MKYLGHVLSQDALKPDESKEHAERFLRRNVIPNLSDHTEPLTHGEQCFRLLQTPPERRATLRKISSVCPSALHQQEDRGTRWMRYRPGEAAEAGGPAGSARKEEPDPQKQDVIVLQGDRITAPQEKEQASFIHERHAGNEGRRRRVVVQHVATAYLRGRGGRSLHIQTGNLITVDYYSRVKKDTAFQM